MRIRSQHRDRGFTILELLLVLALLVTISSLAAPHVGRTLDNHRLRSSGEQVRGAWAKARVRAMEKGQTYVFRFEVDGTKYLIEPWMSQDDYLESAQLTMAGGTPVAGQAVSAAGGVAESQSGGFSEESELAEGVQFVAAQLAEDARAYATAQTGSATVASDTVWSDPVFFYPDGTATTAKLSMVNVRERGLEVSMRGLTGVIYVKSVSVDGSSLGEE